MVECVRVSGLREVHRDGVPDGNQRNHLFTDPLMHTTQNGLSAVADGVAQGRGRILPEIRKGIVGQGTVIDQVSMALITGGHSSITGVRSPAKTLMIKTLAE